MPSKQYLPQQLDKLKSNIDHIVVLMLENRSFDNLLGWLYDKDGPPSGQEFDGLNKAMWNPLDNIDSNGNPFTEQVPIRKNGEDYYIGGKKVKSKGVDYSLPNPDPGEGFADTTYQLYGTYKVDADYPPMATNQGFVNNYKDAQLFGTYTYQDGVCDPREIMTCYTPEQVFALSTLAKEYAVCDQWFCSVPSQTLTNRDFFHAAQSEGQVNNDPNGPCGAKTIFNQIQDAITNDKRDDLSWKVYSGTDKGKPFSLTRTIMTQLHDYSMNDNFESIEQFYEDAENGNLPSYCFLEPQFHDDPSLKKYQNDMHPPTDIRTGDLLIAEVYNAIIKNKKWENTLLVITYDEHGGCYDHVPPPNKYVTPPEDGAPAGQNGFKFNRLGIRVPTVLVSPWIKKNTIARPLNNKGYEDNYEHTSVIRTIQECFDLEGHLTNRDANAVDISGVLNLDTPRTDAAPLKLIEIKEQPASEVNDLHRVMAAALAKYTGKPLPSEDEILEEMGKMYQDHFNTDKQ